MHRPLLLRGMASEAGCAVVEDSCPAGPVALVFGWAGASHKNVDKYSEVWRAAGCSSVQVTPVHCTVSS